MTEQEIKVGQVWRRKHDGREIRIERVRQIGPDWRGGVDVHWRGVDKPGRGALFDGSLRKRYELVEKP